jgi:hypothetical protein
MHDSIYHAPKIDLAARTREAERWIRETTGRPPRPREAEAVARILKGRMPAPAGEPVQDD